MTSIDQSFTLPRIRIATHLGDIVVELRPDCAPRAVAAFLAEVRAGNYDGGQFGRIVRADNDNAQPGIEVIQGGCADQDDMRLEVELEQTAETGLRHLDGTISLPRLDGGPGCAQGFFICIGAQPALDSGGGRTADGLGFAAFGQVIDGMDTVHEIHRLPTLPEAPIEMLKGQLPVEPPHILRMTIEAPADRMNRGRDGAAE